MPAPPVPPFPDIELLLAKWLPLQNPPVTCPVCTKLPFDLPQLIIRVVGTGGTNLSISLASPECDINVYGFDRDAVYAMSLGVQNQLLVQLPGTVTPQGVVQWVKPVTFPHWLPDANPAVFVSSASYEIRCHS